MKTFAIALTVLCSLHIAAYADDLSWTDKKSSPARGMKTCTIRESLTPSRRNLVVNVDRSGRASISVREDKYPGTNQFFLISGKRYSGPSNLWVQLDQTGLSALKSEEKVSYTWYDWPYRSEHNQAGAILGFAQSYAECLDFLRKP